MLWELMISVSPSINKFRWQIILLGNGWKGKNTVVQKRNEWNMFSQKTVYWQTSSGWKLLKLLDKLLSIKNFIWSEYFKLCDQKIGLSMDKNMYLNSEDIRGLCYSINLLTLTAAFDLKINIQISTRSLAASSEQREALCEAVWCHVEHFQRHWAKISLGSALQTGCTLLRLWERSALDVTKIYIQKSHSHMLWGKSIKTAHTLL